MSASFQRTYTNFSSGLNLQAGPIVIDGGNTEALQIADICENWDATDLGLIKSPGYTQVLSSPLSGRITGIFEYRSAATGLRELIVCAGTGIYKVSGNSATLLKSGQTADNPYQSVTWADNSGNEIIILMNGVDTPCSYNGTSCAAISFTDNATPIWNNAKPKGAAVFRGRIFYWGDPSKPHRVYTPQPGTFDNFDNTTKTVDAFDVDPGYGGVVTGVRALTDNLLAIYKQRCVRRLSGTTPFGSALDEFSITPVTNEFGCIAPRTLVGDSLTHYFLSEDGVRNIGPAQGYGDVDPTQPTYPIQPLINGLNFTETVITNAVSVLDRQNKQMLIAVPNGSNTNNNLVISGYLPTGALRTRREDDIKASSYGVFNREVYFGDYAGHIYRLGASNGNNGDTMVSTFESKYIAHGGIGAYKRYKDIFIYADADGAGDVVVQWQILRRGKQYTKSGTASVTPGSGAWDSAVWDTAVWSTTTQNSFHIKNPGRGNAIKFRFVANSATQRPKIRSVDIYGEIFGVKLG